MAKRIIEPDLEKSKELTKLKKKAKNKTELRRIDYVVSYLRLWSTRKVYESLWWWVWAINFAVNEYKKDQENFYKTKYPWRQKSDERKDIEDKINKIIKERQSKWLQTDIETVREIFNRRYKNIKILNYNQAWHVIRKKLKLSYQKPYISDSRKLENAEEILKDRLKGWLGKVEQLEKQKLKDEWLQNKKT